MNGMTTDYANSFHHSHSAAFTEPLYRDWAAEMFDVICKGVTFSNISCHVLDDETRLGQLQAVWLGS